ncbi:uncharacterized protein KQ657_004868 [Scheffersomyces spartinae]|uniref:Uncharacterized protein n=1 Tax=Scheffersomyces spartinae TaxID=45513 RepID=A0A9P8AIY1_9ASCO|nr:uncharacterized protein KQ657_004868 [Scheffersomyces spartinae]KAG7194160.1 hypothetical protein KQ657_004868 [Scheffersomyces spartinae]
MLNTLYVLPESPRNKFLMIFVDYFKLDINVTNELSKTFAVDFPLKKRPALVTSKGEKICESVAILIYLCSLVPEDEKLLGINPWENAQILKYILWGQIEVLPSYIYPFMMAVGICPYKKKDYDESMANLELFTSILETRLANYTYLVSERISIADVLNAYYYSGVYATVGGNPFTKKYPSVYRWFLTVSKNSFFEGVQFKIAAEPLTYQPPKKVVAPKKEAVPKFENVPVEEKKQKHPLESLGKPSNALDNWKRVYSNEETRPVAIPWFWENQWNPEEWSLWKVDYKYNDELEKTFMTNNQIGGFFARLSASTKYLFGCLVVYGVDNDNGITGAFLIRGQEYAPAFDVAPDWDTYNYTRLNPENDKDRKFIENMFAWDEPVIVNREKKVIADGKVFK